MAISLAKSHLLLLVLTMCWLPSPTEAQSSDPSHNVRLEFQVVEANGFERPDPAIAEVVEQLRRLFRFEGYRLLETSVLRGVLSPRTNVVSQILALPDHGRLEIEAWLVASATPGVARTTVRMRYADGQRPNGPKIIDVSVNVRDGQTVVLGSGRPLPQAGALILIMTMHVEDEGT